MPRMTQVGQAWLADAVNRLRAPFDVPEGEETRALHVIPNAAASNGTVNPRTNEENPWGFSPWNLPVTDKRARQAIIDAHPAHAPHVCSGDSTVTGFLAARPNVGNAIP